MDEIMLTTVDTVRTGYFMHRLAGQFRHVLLTGPSCTGKSARLNHEIATGFSDGWVSLSFVLCAPTTAGSVQEIIDGKVEKRRRGIFGPPLGKRLLVFADDLHMPIEKASGVQPPIELLRQWMDCIGWYERKTCGFRTLQDMQFLAAMRSQDTVVTSRYLRHYQILELEPMNIAVVKDLLSRFVGIVVQRLPATVAGMVGPFCHGDDGTREDDAGAARADSRQTAIRDRAETSSSRSERNGALLPRVFANRGRFCEVLGS
jgi:dynein heavy chain